MPTDTTMVACSVCGESAPSSATAECNWCDQRYHLNQRNDIEGKDCGLVWIDEQYLALQFACNTCIADADRAGGVAPVAAPASRAPRPTADGDAPRRRRYRRRA